MGESIRKIMENPRRINWYYRENVGRGRQLLKLQRKLKLTWKMRMEETLTSCCRTTITSLLQMRMTKSLKLLKLQKNLTLILLDRSLIPIVMIPGRGEGKRKERNQRNQSGRSQTLSHISLSERQMR